MGGTIGAEDRTQLEAALALIREVLGGDLLGAYIYGSAVAGDLRQRSDLDLLAVSRRPTSDAEKRRLIAALMPLSGSRAVAGPARSLEITIAVQPDIRPWRYPPPLDFQYGDWFRPDYERGDVAPWASPNPDLAVLLTTALAANEPLFGPDLAGLVDTVPREDVERAMLDGVPDLLADLEDDTANVLLTLARIWHTLTTGEISAKDVAADWASDRLPIERRAGLARARAVYVGDAPDRWDDLRPTVDDDARRIVEEVRQSAPTGSRQNPRRARYEDALS